MQCDHTSGKRYSVLLGAFSFLGWWVTWCLGRDVGWVRNEVVVGGGGKEEGYLTKRMGWGDTLYLVFWERVGTDWDTGTLFEAIGSLPVSFEGEGGIERYLKTCLR